MADDPIETFRLSLMQDVLPVGMALVERAKKGGVTKLAEAFTDSDNPLEVLRVEGEPSAKNLREQLDRVSPGLGNPVVPVEVAVEHTNPQPDQALEQQELLQVLDRIQLGLDELENRWFDSVAEDPTITSEEG